MLLHLPIASPEDYRSARPFPHAVFDGVVSQDDALSLAQECRLMIGPDLYVYDNALERKRAMDDESRMLPAMRDAHRALAAPRFLLWLEQLTGIDDLVPDPYLRGGGVHLIPPGGKLDVHVDFNVHPKLRLARRLNVILYLNPGWTEEQGGHLELWSGYERRDGTRELLRRERRILPACGRAVVFTTSETSYHGHPEPTRGRDWRCSLSAYYYTVAEPAFAAPAHSTAFVRRPQDPVDPEAEALRERRARGRTASNVKMEGRKD